MSAPTPPIFYVRKAYKAEKLVLDLGVARDRALVAYNASAVTLLNKGTGSFTLIFHFKDGSELEITSEECESGDVFEFDVEKLFLSNPAQTGLSITLLIDYQKEG
jgi:hypothetical protein